jgi:hypothetical protein
MGSETEDLLFPDANGERMVQAIEDIFGGDRRPQI